MTTARDRPPEEAAEDTSFARGLRLLLTVADRGEVRADELSRCSRCRSRPSTATCERSGEFGFVERRGGQFGLGPKLLIGSGANVSSERLIRHADAALRMLVQETGETAIVVRRIRLSRVCLHRSNLRGRSARPTSPRCRRWYAGAPGRVLLAFAPP